MSYTKFLLSELKSGRITRPQFLRLLQSAPRRSNTAFLHPLLERNTSDLSEQRFSTRLKGGEFFLADHRVQGERVLPAVAYVEMARAAVERSVGEELDASAGWEFEQLEWVAPLTVSEEREVHLALEGSDPSGWVEYEIYSDADAANEQNLHARGRVRARGTSPHDTSPQGGEAAAMLDVRALAGQSESELAAEQCYEAFARLGIEYGAAHRALKWLQVSGTGSARYVLARWELPESVRSDAAQYELHPSVLDGALQAVVGLRWGEGDSASVPFAMRRVRVYGPSGASGYVHVTSEAAGDTYRVQLCDESGRVSVQIEGLLLLPLKHPAHAYEPGPASAVASVPTSSMTPAADTPLTLVPRWDPVVPDFAPSPSPDADSSTLLVGAEVQCERWRPFFPRATVIVPDADHSVEAFARRLDVPQTLNHVVWLAPSSDPQALEGLIGAQEAGLISLFRLLKALLSSGYGKRALTLTIVTWQTQAVGVQETIYPAHASVHGLIGSLAKEYEHWKVRLIDAPSECAGSKSLPFDELLRLPTDARGDGWAYRAGEWYRQKLVAVESPRAPREATYRNGGVYVMIGGAGGLGEVFSEHLIRNHKAQVVWIGRRELDDELRAKIQRLSKLGPAPEYHRADAADGAALQRIRDDIKNRHGAIHGVVHAALVLLDSSFAQMTESRFRESTRSKIDSSICMARVFGREPLDWFVFFSSFQSFAKLAGQSNYAAGCTCVDALAHWLRSTSTTPTKVMSWGYWGSVGIVSSETHRIRMERQGIGSIEPPEGIRALQELLASPLDQVIVLKTTRPELVERLSDTSERIVYVDGRRSSESAAGSEAGVGNITPVAESVITESKRMDAMLARLLRVQLAPARNGHSPGHSATHQRWLAESLHILESRESDRDRSAVGDAATAAVNESSSWEEWAEQTARWRGIPGLAARARLAETALRALPDILSGRVTATSILFPNASLELVEPIYAGNPVSDHFNGILAEAVVQRIVRLDDASCGKARLLEVGAGTGGTTKLVLDRLQEHAARIEEYLYTDVSRGFLLHGKQRFGATGVGLRTAVLDVERPLHDIALGSYDVVIATNVLHATRSIRNTLRNVKAALRRGGALLINEVACHSLFAHLTFGLLDGWWLFDDPAVRIPGTPALAPDSWRRVLQDEGFSRIEFPARASHCLGQQVIVAESDGVVRQRRSASSPVAREGARELAGTAGERVTRRPRTTEPAVTTSSPPPQPSAPNPSGKTVVDSNAVLVERTIAALKKVVSEALLVAEEELRHDEPLDKYGVDSIFVVNVTRRLDAHIPGLSSTVFFEHRTLGALARHLVEQEREAVARWVGVAEEPTKATNSEPSAAKLLPVLVASPVGVGTQGMVETRALTGVHGGTRRVRRWKAARAADRANSHNVNSHNADGSHDANSSESADSSVTQSAIAIVGLSGRYPQARTLDELWNNLKTGKNCIREVPRERWDWRDYHSAVKGERGKIYSRWGGFIEGIDHFDPMFFRILPIQAEQMDPQERLFLQEAYACIEDAGYTPASLCASSKRIGVYVGVMNDTYSHNPRHWSVANRVSYSFDFQGPSMAVDTACSSSLTALHLAVESLRSGDCETAIAGGVNLIVAPEHYMALSAMSMLAMDERCKAFGAGADGFVGGEGVGAVLLKPLARAVAAGDHIYGIIRATAVNSGGRTNGYTVPNLAAQRDVIRTALARAKLDARAISYVEAHGTGTELGDPIEIEALSQAFDAARIEEREYVDRDRRYCAIGSLKSNIGHLESAAGIAGLTKVLLQLRHGQLVTSLHSRESNPRIDFARTPFQVQQCTAEWRRPTLIVDGRQQETARIAGISSFGAGGANAHVIVEEYREPAGQSASSAPAEDPSRHQLILLSARDPERLHEQVNQLLVGVAGGRYVETDLPRIAYTLQVGRDHMEHRVAFMVRSLDELQRKLTAYTQGGLDANGDDAWFSGNMLQHRGALSAFDADEDATQLVDMWISKEKYAKLLALWVKGLTYDWSRLYQGDRAPFARPGRISLPTYPFAADRYWRPRAALRDRSAHTEGDRLHPLVHRNTSTFSKQSFVSRLSRDDIAMLVSEDASCDVVPAVLLLEMARVALTLSEGRTVDVQGRDARDIGVAFEDICLAPVLVPAQQTVCLGVDLERDETGAVCFEIVQLDMLEAESALAGERSPFVASGIIRLQGVGESAASAQTDAPVQFEDGDESRIALADDAAEAVEQFDALGAQVRVIYHRVGADQHGRLLNVGRIEADHAKAAPASVPARLAILDTMLRRFANPQLTRPESLPGVGALRADSLEIAASDFFSAHFRAADAAMSSLPGAIDVDLHDVDGRILVTIRGLHGERSDSSSATPAAARAATFQAPTPPPNDCIAEYLATALGLAGKDIDPDRSLDEYGMDSVIAVQLARHLEKSFGIAIGARDLVEHGTVRRLARLIGKLHGAQSQSADGVTPSAEEAPSFPARDTNERIPLSRAQRSIFMHEQAARGRPIYHVPICLRLRGELDAALLRQALHEIVRRHETLRTTIRHAEGTGWQIVHEFLEPEWTELDHRGDSSTDALDAWKTLASRPFDLEAGPLLRVTVIRLDGESILALCAHHLIVDGWSVGVLIEELLANYKGLRLGSLPHRVPLTRQYGDYVSWRSPAGNEAARAAESRIAERLRDVPTLDLATRREERPALQSFDGATRSYSVSAATAGRIRQVCQSGDGSPFAFLVACFEMTLARLTGQTRFAIGIPFANRHVPELAPLIGHFASTVPIAADVTGVATFSELQGKVRSELALAQRDDAASFEEVLRIVGGRRDPRYSPGFQVMCVMQPAKLENRPGEPLTADLVGVDLGVTLFDLVMQVAEVDERFEVFMTFNRTIVSDERMAAMMVDFAKLVELASVVPDRPLAELIAGLPTRVAPEPAEALTANAIPPPVAQAPGSAEGPSSDAGARDVPDGYEDMAQTLTRLWSDGLQLPGVSIDDDFILLGGTSLAATQVLNQIRLRYGLDLPLRAIFESPTIAEFIARHLSRPVAGEDRPTAGAQPAGSRIPASHAQVRLAFLDRLEPGTAAYNVPMALRLRGALDVEALEVALNAMDERHDALRSSIEIEGGADECWQFLLPHRDEALPIVDLADCIESEREIKLQALCEEEAARPFDLKRGPMWRRRLIRCGAEDHCLLLTLHHAACDGWSIGVLAREISTLYEAKCAGRPAVLPPLPITYGDYSVWQRSRQARQAAELAYWTTQLADAPRLDLPTDRIRSAVKRGKAAIVRRDLSPEQAVRVRTFVASRRTTPFMALLSALAVVLHQHTGQKDVIVGSSVAGRTTAELEPMVGCFINTVAMRVRPDPDGGFTALLAQVRETVVAALSNQSCPFERVLEELYRDPTVSRTPLVQVMFNYIDVPPAHLRLADMDVEARGIERTTAKFDLDLIAREDEGSIALELEYDTGLFEERTASRLLEHMLEFLAAAVVAPQASMRDLASAALGKRQPVLPWPLPRPSGLLPFNEGAESITERFKGVVAACASAVAVTDGAHKLTFTELDGASTELARRVWSELRGPDCGSVRIALLCAHDWHMPIAVLAALKTGCVYVPLDPRAPNERLQTIVEDAGCGAIVFSPAFRERAKALARGVSEAGAPLALLEVHSPGDIAPEQTGWVAPHVAAATPAYILYTSGSTGKPKGVLQSQENVVAHMRAYVERIGIGPGDRVAMLAGYVFDAGVMDLFGSVLSGANLVLVDPRAHTPAHLRKALEPCSILHATPTLFRYLTQDADNSWHPKARVVVLGGEEVRSSDVTSFRLQFRTGCRLVNGLGPTECTLAMQYCLEDGDADRAAIAVGHPVPGVEIELVDECGRPAPVRGEIVIRSPALALGYWRQDERTKEAFSDMAGVRRYRTGDLGRWRADGALIFCGRKDQQVKIRGHRVELGEIESVLRTHSTVGDAVVIADRRQDAQMRLVAFVTGIGELAIEPQDLLVYLRRRLPEYAVPSMVLPIDALPLTLTGKVDRARLPAIPRAAEGAVVSPPRNPTERTIAGIWREVLGLEAVGRDQNFFDLGGHSLLLARVQSALVRELGRSVSMTDMFAFPTISALASALDVGAANADECQDSRVRAVNRREMLRKRKMAEVQAND